MGGLGKHRMEFPKHPGWFHKGMLDFFGSLIDDTKWLSVRDVYTTDGSNPGRVRHQV